MSEAEKRKLNGWIGRMKMEERESGREVYRTGELSQTVNKR